MTPFNGKCQNLQMSPTHFCTSSYHFRDIKNLPSKRRSRSHIKIFPITPFDNIFPNLKMSLTHFCSISYQRYKFKMLPPKSRSRSRSAILSINSSMANIKIYKCPPHIYCASFYHFRYYKY